jgi:SAM-dependent methyltransferase
MSAGTDHVPAYRDGVAWARGPQPVYDRLASAALSSLPYRLDGVSALDVGAGTGAASRELLRRGADVVAVDTSASMLAELVRQTDGRVPAIVGDVRRLALPDGGFAVTVAAFVLNHVADPTAAVRELARVTRRDGRVVATTFGADEHPIKAAVDAALVRYGYVHPQWYRTLKQECMPRTAATAALVAVATEGGLADVTVEQTDVDLGDLPPRAAIAYRLGLAHIAPFVAALDATDRARLTTELTEVVSELPPLRLPMLVLSGRG